MTFKFNVLFVEGEKARGQSFERAIERYAEKLAIRKRDYLLDHALSFRLLREILEFD